MEHIDHAIMVHAAKLCSDSYRKNLDAPTSRSHRVEQYRIHGELFAFVEFEESMKNAFVVFRGTSSEGNWGLTNLQAYKTPFDILDDQVKSEGKEHRVQGSAYRTLLPGKIHQGFYRAFSWLWYGTEPVLDFGTIESKYFARRTIRHGVLIGVPLAVGMVLGMLLGQWHLFY